MLASGALHRLEPWAYLCDLVCLLPAWPQRRVLGLAPAPWARTGEQQETRERLAANPFRLALLALDRHADAEA